MIKVAKHLKQLECLLKVDVRRRKGQNDHWSIQASERHTVQCYTITQSK